MLLANVRAGARLHMDTVRITLSPSSNVFSRANRARLATAIFCSPSSASRLCATTSANSSPPLTADSGCSSDIGSSSNSATGEGEKLASMFREPVNRNNITKGTLGDAIAEMVRSREQGEAAHRNGGGGGGTGPAKKKIDTTHAPKMRRGDKDHDNVRQRRSGPSRAETNASRGERWSKSSPLSLSSSPSQTQAEGNRREEGGAEISAPTPRFQRFGRPGGGGGVAASEIFRDRDQVHRSRRDGDASGKRDGGRASGKNFDDVHADWGGRSDVHEWLKENVVVNSGTAASMLEREPRISQQSSEIMTDILAWFRQTLNLSEETTRSMIVRKPSLLCRSLKDNLEPKVRERMMYPILPVACIRFNVCSSLHDAPGGLLYRRNSRNIQSGDRVLICEEDKRVDWLKELCDVDDKEAGSIIRRSPNIVTSDVKNMQSKVTWLAQRLGVSHAEISRVVAGCPAILTNGISTGLEPRLKWMQAELFRDETEMREHILRSPALVGHSLYGTLVPTFRTLKDSVGMDPHRVRTVLQRNPAMFTCHLGHNLVEKKTWLRRELEIDSEEDLKRVLNAEPRLLIRTNERLNAYLRFFMDRMGATVADVRDAVLREPWLLMVSLETRWLPNLNAMRERGVEVDFRRHWPAVVNNRD